VPIVVGGLGGSGTRAVAQVLQQAGVYIGSCLNEPLDNLWFTLLFRRPARVKSPNDLTLNDCLDVFEKRMLGNPVWNASERNLLRRCALEFAINGYVRNERFGFPYRVYRSFFQHRDVTAERWGWKEPNAHVFLPLLQNRYPNLRYIHVMRHPLDIVFGKNHLQLRNWKHLFNIDEPDAKRAMLLYYKAANKRAIDIGKPHENKNFLLLKHEDLCHQPVETIDKLLAFCSLNVDDATRQTLHAIPSREKVNTDYARHDYTSLMPLANDVATQFGYTVA